MRTGVVMARTCRDTGLGHLSPHHLRHTHASKLIGNGWDPIEVAARLGDTVITVERTYVHEWQAARRREDQRDRPTAPVCVRVTRG